VLFGISPPTVRSVVPHLNNDYIRKEEKDVED
jgi:hypothetical protein